MPESHALLSASSAHRWLNCPPSAKAVEGAADAPSDAALQGTAAHVLAEHKLLRALKRRSKRPTSEWIDNEMETLTDDYVNFVLEHLSNARETCADAQVFVEQRLDYSHVALGGFGTGDCVILAEPVLHIIDLKYGMGVEVSPEANPQLMLYGLGALAAFDALYDIREVRLSIFQPRRGNVATWTIPAEDLTTWAGTRSHRSRRLPRRTGVSTGRARGASSAGSLRPAVPERRQIWPSHATSSRHPPN